MDSYNPFTNTEDPFEEDQSAETSKENSNTDLYSLLRPAAFYVFLIIVAIGIVSIFMRPVPDIVVVVENGDGEITNEVLPIPENTTTTISPITTRPTTLAPTTTIPQSISSIPVSIYKQEEILKKTVQVVVNDCLSRDQENTSFTGLGSGVIVSSSGHILTNAHVLENCNGDIQIATVQNVDSKSEITYIAKLLKIDSNLDLALLLITSHISGYVISEDFEYFEMKSSSDLQLGESLEIWGYPSSRGDGMTYSLNINLTKGTVSGFEQDTNYKRGWIVTDADISYGNSGGAALDITGKLIGMPTFGVTEGASWIGYLRTADVLQDWAREYLFEEKDNNFYGIPQLEIRQVDLNAIPKYDREEWNSWIDNDGDCQNTRHEVLQLESYVTVLFTSSNECYVQSGRWFDPYNGEFFYFASDLDIDHFIPLYNAHISGGWQWSEEMKTDFANNIDNPDILIAVKNTTNREKSASSPDEWKPENQLYWCEYAYDWIRIKHEWELTATKNEWSALMQMIETCPKDFTFEDAINKSHIFSDEKIERYELSGG